MISVGWGECRLLAFCVYVVSGGGKSIDEAVGLSAEWLVR